MGDMCKLNVLTTSNFREMHEKGNSSFYSHINIMDDFVWEKTGLDPTPLSYCIVFLTLFLFWDTSFYGQCQLK